MKSEILKILRGEQGVVSGEWLSDCLKTSRVSVWKHIKKLQECGYEIESTNKGYELLKAPDIPYPWEFPPYKDRMVYHREVTSTMDEARGMARKGASHLSVVVAGRQKKGRGRLERKWHSNIGGLYFTVIVRPKLPPALSFKANFAASLALVKTLRENYSIDAAVKWPNDIIVGEKKLSGMLSEMETESDLVKYINIGMGINVNTMPADKTFQAVSMKELLNQKVSLVELLGNFLNRFEDTMAGVEDKDVVAEWKQYAGTLNRAVKVVTVNEETEGVAKDVDETGALMVELPDGEIKRVIYGDCFHTASKKK